MRGGKWKKGEGGEGGGGERVKEEWRWVKRWGGEGVKGGGDESMGINFRRRRSRVVERQNEKDSF